MTAKETVRALLDRLPNDCSLDDVLYHLYVVQAVGRGLADGEAGRVIPHQIEDTRVARRGVSVRGAGFRDVAGEPKGTVIRRAG